MTPDHLSSHQTGSDATFAAVGATDPNAAVLAITESLFGKGAQLVEELDPEIPGVSYLVVRVRANLSVEEVVRRENKWDELVIAAVGAVNPYVIMVDVR
jgi:hypothetical protein